MATAVDPEVAALARVARAHREERYFRIVDRAIERGELPRGTPPRLVTEPLMSVAYLRLCVMGEAMPREQLEPLVDLVLAGARATTPPAR
jgi:hypothetical protein